MANTVPRTNAVGKMCRSKRQYKTEAEAAAEANRWMKKVGEHPKHLRIYKCPVCNWFHITKKEHEPKTV